MERERANQERGGGEPRPIRARGEGGHLHKAPAAKGAALLRMKDWGNFCKGFYLIFSFLSVLLIRAAGSGGGRSGDLQEGEI
ncbi:Hypothetical predicted protein [Podarcis lilfordi]|uniref:Uncharacterized protein n=1 Tax=Podarcis lilfordi TaxID=74358 RepID=A0AA35PUY8_9SAUR|nr:Hypothetical predicted protein [Podarcis lilfordi]